MRDTRTSVVVAGAAAVVGALWAPWYAIDFAARSARRRSAQGSPAAARASLGEFARGLLVRAARPHRRRTRWQALREGRRRAARAARWRGVRGAARPHGRRRARRRRGAGDDRRRDARPARPRRIVSLQWGPWLALAGARAIVAAWRGRSRDGSPTERRPRTVTGVASRARRFAPHAAAVPTTPCERTSQLPSPSASPGSERRGVARRAEIRACWMWALFAFRLRARSAQSRLADRRVPVAGCRSGYRAPAPHRLVLADGAAMRRRSRSPRRASRRAASRRRC